MVKAYEDATVMRALLTRAFDALENECHIPEQNSECDKCALMWEIEQAVGRQLTGNRRYDVIALESVRPK